MGTLAFGSGYFGEYALGGEVPITTTLLGVICTGRIGDGLLGFIDGRENGHVSDTVVGIVEEDVTEDVLVCS